MSNLIVVNQGEEAFLDLILAANYTLRLYQNNVTLGLSAAQIDQLTQASFTEANFAGYSAAALTGGSWVTTQANPSTGVYAQQTFTRSSTGTAQLIYGYYITLTAGGALRWFEHFDAPISVEFNGDAIQVTPTITLDDTEGNAVEAGTITAFGASTAPAGWLLCNGAAVSRSTFANLFAVIGTTYGVGDGSTTFNVPDLRQRFPLGQAASGTGATLGGTGGAIDHVHGLDTSSSGAHIRMVTGDIGVRIEEKAVASWTSTNSGHPGLTAQAEAGGLTTGARLAGDSDTGNPPFLTVAYIIKS